MNYAVPNLRNEGLVCYLNSGIQAISACSLFTKSINNLYNSNKDLCKLKDFNNLLKSMDDSGYINIATNNIFSDWNKYGQQDSFNLIAYVINQVYDEIRQDMERRGVIEKRSLDQWLTVKLPLKMKMQYIITCECGFIEKSPFQSEIALHLSFLQSDNGGVIYSNFIKSLVNNYKDLHIDDLLRTHFEKEKICDFQCRSKFCKSKVGWRNLKLYLPLPDSICIHLQRNLWTGTKMQKINDHVLFKDIIIIKEEYLNASNVNQMKSKEEYGNDGDGNVGHDQSDVDREVHYYLKSVIVHHGEESFGHYICYKKSKGHWFYTNDTTVYPVIAQNVFSCNPYILFYEKENEVQMSPTIIKVDEKLNIFINAISSCVSFMNWLNKMSDNNDNIIIKRLLYLTNLVITRNEKFEKDILADWDYQNNTYVTMTSIFKDIGVNNRENSAEEYICGFISSRKIYCDCSFYTSSPSEFQGFLKIFVKISVIYSDIQTLVDERMKEEKIIGNSCNLKGCTREYGMQRLYFQTTPRILCIEIDSSIYSKISLLEKLVIKKEYFTTTLIRDETYELRSVITESGRCCYRKINDNWHEVKDKLIKLVSINEVLKCKPHFLFYESKDRITINRLLSCILHSLSSCSTFIEWLDAVKTRREMIKGRCLFELIKIINGQYQGYRGEEILRRWNDSHCNDAYLLLKIILQDLEEEMDSTSGSDEVSQKCYLNNPMKLNIYKRECYTNNDIKTNLKSKLILNISLTEEDYHNEEMHTIQKMLDKYFNNKVCKVNEDNKYKCKVHVNNKQNVLIEPFPSIICIKINLFYEEDGKCMKFTNILKLSKKINILCSNTILYRKEYKLRSVIKVENFPSEIYYCFKETDNGWIFIKNESIVPSSEKEVLETESYIAFYEIVNSIETLKDSTFEDFRNNNTNNDQPIKYDEDLIESSSERSSFKYECICDLHSDEDFLNSLNPNLSDLKHNTISFGDIPFNERLNNFLQSILFCTKLIRNCKRFLNDSDSCSKYNSLFNKIHEVIESQTISLNVHEYEILTSLSQSAFLSDIECFAKIFSEILKPNDLVKDNCLQKVRFIYNIL